MAIVFIASLFLLFYGYVGYPATLWLVAILREDTIKKDDVLPSVTLIISAYNEETIIEAKLRNTLALDYPSSLLDVVVASESTDRTDDIVREYSHRGIRLYASSPRKGKAATLRSCVPTARGEVLVFSDANAMYAHDSLRTLVRSFADKRVGAVSGRLEYISDATSAKSGVTQNEGLYWRYEQSVKNLESRLGMLLGANGSIFAIRRDLYEPLSDVRGDDFELPVQVILRGFRSVIEPDAVSQEYFSTHVSQEFRRRVRIVSWNLESVVALATIAWRRRSYFVLFQLAAHKCLRWCSVGLMLTLLISSAALNGKWFQTIFAGQLALYVVAAIGWCLDRADLDVPRFAKLPYYFCAIHLASGAGVLKSLAGNTKETWERTR